MKKIAVLLCTVLVIVATTAQAAVTSLTTEGEQQKSSYLEPQKTSFTPTQVMVPGTPPAFNNLKRDAEIPQGMTRQPNAESAVKQPGPMTGKQEASSDANKQDATVSSQSAHGALQLQSQSQSQSRLELRLNKANLLPYQVTAEGDAKPPLVQFGYGFFNGLFKPQADAPVASDYVVSAGDRIALTIWGTPADGALLLEVSRRGEISLPRVGVINVAGIQFSRLQEKIEKALSRSFTNAHCSVDIGQLHSVKVYVVGEVANPGGYDIPALSTVINALEAAGGPSKNGTLRAVEVQRLGKIVATIDLYDFFNHGNKENDVRLQSGDTIFVGIIGPTIAVGGEVKRPAIYELKGEQTLTDALSLAGGLTPTARKGDIQVVRVEAHKGSETKTVNLNVGDSLANPIRDMDIITVGKVDSALRNTVRVEGHLLKTEDREFRKGMRVSNVITAADILPESSPVAELTRYSAPGLTPEKIIFSIAKALAGDASEDIELRDSDTIKIFSKWEKEEMPKVRIRGEVQTPGEYRLYDGMSLGDLIQLVGYMKKSAFVKNVEVARTVITGTEVSTRIIIADMTSTGPKMKLEPYDEVTIRRIPNWAEETERYVELKGEFTFPGVYPISRGETVSSVISRAGGFTKKAYLPAVKFTRKAVQEEQQLRMQEVIRRTEDQIAKQQADLAVAASSKEELESMKASLAGLTAGLDRLKGTRAEGRVVVSEKEMLAQPGSADDIELAGGDVIEVKQVPSSVSIMGQVYNPISAVYKTGRIVSDYLAMTGGFNQDAAKDEIYLVRANGTVVSRSQYPWYSSFMNEAVLPGDTIVIPQDLQRTAWMRTVKDITTILSQVAMTAGVIIAAGL